MLRNVNWLKVFGNFFILFVITTISFIYYTFMFIVNFPFLEPEVKEINFTTVLRLIYLVHVHVCLIMTLWSFLKTTITDPGKVPLHWGFHLDDTEVKKRRYCLICHIFKPERCHHCSICNRCVLNMDHHCPWVNNCIGFDNRKFFLLLIFYALISIVSVLAGLLFPAFTAASNIATRFELIDLTPNVCVLVTTLILMTLLSLLVFFVRYHIQLLMTNTTTIEDLEKKRTNMIFNYDIGTRHNFEQVFGTNPFMWPFPFYGESGKPIGDGVSWDQRLVNRNESVEMTSS